MSTVIVTGASSGIGRAVAAQLVQHGHRVIGTSRDASTVSDRLNGVEYRDLDLNSPESIRSFAAGLADVEVDVLINNAGESQCGPLEELPVDAMNRLFQLNVLGPIELSQLVLPGMRARGRGRIVNVGSMLASFPLAYRSSYAATKAAIKAFSTAARHELAPFGIQITTVEPGSIDTGISTRRTKYIADDSPYREAFAATIASLDAKEAEGISAETVATTVVDVVHADSVRSFYAVGSGAPWVFLAQRLLPRSIIETCQARAFGARSS